MLTKIYAALWIIIAFTAGLLYLTGYFSMPTAVVFGFIVFGMIFMGMMCVLPSTVGHPRLVRHVVPTTQPQKIMRQPTFRERARAFRNDLMNSNGAEIRNPKFH
jgi:hypothetical protein